MRKRRFNEAQIIGMIKEQEAGMPTAEVCRKHGLKDTGMVRISDGNVTVTDDLPKRIDWNQALLAQIA